MKLVESFLTKNPCYTSGKKIKVKGLMLHSVGCSQPNASVFIKRWNDPDYKAACVHGFIDGIDGTVYQTLPWDHRGWHGGGSSNNTHIGVEMCEPACIKYTGGAKFTCSNVAEARAVAKRTYEAAVELFAMLCSKFGLDPLADGVIVSHSEGHKRGIASGHADPEHLWTQLGMAYTMNGFRQDVKAAMTGQPVQEKPTLSNQQEKPVQENQQVTAEGDSAKVIWDFLTVQCGLNAFAAAGIMGNLYAESGLRPDNLQNSFEKKLGMGDSSYTEAVDSGKYGKEAFVNDKAGYGLAQWTYWSRKQALYEFAKANGASIGDMHMQLAFFWKEVSSNKALLAKLQNAASVLEASNAILHDYERPADQSEAAEKRRAGYGQSFYDLYVKEETAAPTEDPAGPSFLVRVRTPYLNIRKGPGINHEKTGVHTGVGTFTIVEVQSGAGSLSGWGLLKSYAEKRNGWIALDCAERV